MSIREGLLATGIVILVIVAADLIRRYLQRNKLRLAIDDKFKDFPAVDLSSELPNGGARVVSKVVPTDLSREMSKEAPKKESTAAHPAQLGGLNVGAAEAPTRNPTEPEFGGSASRSAESENWVIDPRLSGSREPDEAVDLLLELEFKGLGEGASRCLSESETPSATGSAAKPAIKPITATASANSSNSTGSNATGDARATDPQDSADALVATEVIDTSTAAHSPVLEGAESKAGKATLGLIGGAELIDLERPVHELLQDRQQADLSAAAAVAETAKPDPEPVQTQELQPSFFDLDPDLAPEVEIPVSKPKSRRRIKKSEQTETAVSAAGGSPYDSAYDNPPDTLLEDEMLIINVLSKRAPFSGPMLFKLVEACGLEFGDRDIYHRYEEANGRGALQFSMANAVRPGTFDPCQQLPPTTPAVTFFLCLADPTDRMTALECMLATAKCVADNLGGELKDEHRSSLRTQTIEHYRQKVREFERKALTRRR